MSELEQDAPQSIGKYRILGVLGRGSMGVVYRAEDPEIGRIVAVKVLRRVGSAQLMETDAAIERFRIEARSAGQLRHPHIITIFEVNREGDNPYIVMDYIEGEGLDVVIKRSGRLDPPVALRYLEQVAQGLDYAHSKGVVHRDIKPSNLFVDRNGTVFVLDFGVANINESTSGSTGGASNVVMGTPGYMSPEQILSKPLDARSDLFSFAIVAFECFTGKRPFAGTNFTQLINSILHSKPLPLSESTPGLPLSLEAEFEKALSKNPEERYPTAAAFVRALTEAMSSAPAVSAGTPALPPATRPRALSEWRNIMPLGRGKPREKDQAGPGPQRGDQEQAETRQARPNRPNEGGGDSWDRARSAQRQDAFTRSTRASPPEPGSSPLRLFTAILGILCFVLGIVTLWIALSPAKPPKSGSGGDAGGGDAAILPPKYDEEAVTALACVRPPQKGLREMTDAEVLGLIACPSYSETEVFNALEEAKKRSVHNLLEALLVPLSSDSYALRKRAAEIAGGLGDRRIVPTLIPMLDDRDPSVRAAVALALGKLGDRRPLQYMESRILRDENEAVIGELKRSISQITGVPYREPGFGE